jgi:hypothetical protein
MTSLSPLATKTGRVISTNVPGEAK